jgi:hypothetical protein
MGNFDLTDPLLQLSDDLFPAKNFWARLTLNVQEWWSSILNPTSNESWSTVFQVLYFIIELFLVLLLEKLLF